MYTYNFFVNHKTNIFHNFRNFDFFCCCYYCESALILAWTGTHNWFSLPPSPHQAYSVTTIQYVPVILWWISRLCILSDSGCKIVFASQDPYLITILKTESVIMQRNFICHWMTGTYNSQKSISYPDRENIL